MTADAPGPTARSHQAVRSSAVTVALALAAASCVRAPLRLPTGIGTPVAAATRTAFISLIGFNAIMGQATQQRHAFSLA